MSWFAQLLGGGAATLIDSVGSCVDSIVTSDEERLTLKLQLEQEINKFKLAQIDAAIKFNEEATKRHSTDMMSDSWLSKNIRPLALTFLTVSVILLAFLSIFVLDPVKVELVKPWISLFTALMVTVYGFYFGSRGLEKVTKIKDKSQAPSKE